MLPTNFSPVTSTNVGYIPQNLLSSSFNPFATLMKYFHVIPSANSKLLNLNQDHVSKKVIFLVTSLIEMLELPKFGHMTTSTIEFKSPDKKFLVTSQLTVVTS